MDKICSLCGNPLDGFAGVGDHYLCHGETRDCYHLCTVWAGVSHEQLESAIASYRQSHGLTRLPTGRLPTTPDAYAIRF